MQGGKNFIKIIHTIATQVSDFGIFDEVWASLYIHYLYLIPNNIEAKGIGIQMGAPFFTIKNLIKKNHVHVFSSNFILYGDMSARMMNIVQELSPEVEVYSIDEAFFDLSLLKPTTENFIDYGWKIKNKIKQCTGVPCGIGISHTKVLAKIANRIAKKSNKTKGVLALIEDPHLDYALSITSVADIWGIGKRYANFLKSQGIYTAKDFRDADENWVKKNLTIVGLRIQKELRKEKCIHLEIIENPKKSIIFSRSFAKCLSSFEELLSPLSYFVTAGCAKLRKQKSETCQIGVYLRTNPHAKNKEQYNAFKVISLPFYTSCDFHILRAAEIALKSMYKSGFEYKKCGIYFFNLSPESDLPSNLFDSRDIIKERKLFEQLDRIKDKYGRDTIFLANSLGNIWKHEPILRSKEYTSNLNEVMLV